MYRSFVKLSLLTFLWNYNCDLFNVSMSSENRQFSHWFGFSLSLTFFPRFSVPNTFWSQKRLYELICRISQNNIYMYVPRYLDQLTDYQLTIHTEKTIGSTKFGRGNCPFNKYIIVARGLLFKILILVTNQKRVFWRSLYYDKEVVLHRPYRLRVKHLRQWRFSKTLEDSLTIINS